MQSPISAWICSNVSSERVSFTGAGASSPKSDAGTFSTGGGLTVGTAGVLRMPSTPRIRRCSSCFFVSVRRCRSSSEAESMFYRITGFFRIYKISSSKSS